MTWTAPTPPDPSPLIELRERLAAAREHGEEFGAAWLRCCDSTLREISDHKERREWRRALERTEETWRRCFNREPAKQVDRQLSLVGADRGTHTTGLSCEQCGGDIPEGKRRRARFCSRECQQAVPLAA